ncbi:hypothetical protein AVEN_82435-1 [Araneus ventricosus]|uniref:Uncharacterized protein n=1 Tax=Araneus ventricosus TaxID=182803 RepID=A0A4Y2GXV4_ARAVE|nr:hypothetical protein AVEN_82435-1 [Araneus ventricosus]
MTPQGSWTFKLSTLPTSYRHEKTLDTRHACGDRYGNGIFHCILGVKERALFHLAQIEPAEVSFRFVLRSKTNSPPNVVVDFIPISLLSVTRLLEATLLRIFLLDSSHRIFTLATGFSEMRLKLQGVK